MSFPDIKNWLPACGLIMLTTLLVQLKRNLCSDPGFSPVSRFLIDSDYPTTTTRG